MLAEYRCVHSVSPRTVQLSNIPLGTLERDRTQIVSISESVRRKHCALFGKSGVGKTTAIFNMAFADVYGGVGATVIDPHGELCTSLLDIIPRARTNDVDLFQPGRRAHFMRK